MTDEKNFVKAWLAKARITENPEGDLIADMRRDKDIPRTFPSLDAMRTYLMHKNAPARWMLFHVFGSVIRSGLIGTLRAGDSSDAESCSLRRARV
jgi:hypothetical protein